MGRYRSRRQRSTDLLQLIRALESDQGLAFKPAAAVLQGGGLLSHQCTLETLPTVLRSGPYRLFFYSADRDEPPHVHVEREEAEAKFWLVPVRLEMSRGFGRSELRRIESLVEEQAPLL